MQRITLKSFYIPNNDVPKWNSYICKRHQIKLLMQETDSKTVDIKNTQLSKFFGSCHCLIWSTIFQDKFHSVPTLAYPLHQHFSSFS